MSKNERGTDWTNVIIEKIVSGTDMHEINEEAMKHLRVVNPSGKLYKYRAFNKYALNNLIEGTLFCASPNSFNDPFDCRFGIGIQNAVEEVLEREMCRDDEIIEVIGRMLNGETSIDLENDKISSIFNNEQFMRVINEFKESAGTDDEMEEILIHNFESVIGILRAFIPEDSVMKKYLDKGKEISSDLISTLSDEQKREMLQGKYKMLECLKNLGVKGDVDEISALVQIDQIYNPENNERANEVNNIVDNMEQKIVENINNTYFIGSLCTDYKNRLMWSHYANSHKGFCIEYDFSEKCDESNQLLLLPVVYSRERTSLPWSMTQIEETEMYNLALTRTLQALLTKDDAWSYEKEWRVILSGTEKPGNVKMPPISCIYVGALCNGRNRAVLRNIAKKLNVPIKQMKIDRGDYELRTSDIEF